MDKRVGGSHAGIKHKEQTSRGRNGTVIAKIKGLKAAFREAATSVGVGECCSLYCFASVERAKSVPDCQKSFREKRRVADGNLLLLMTILSETFLAFVRSHFVAFSFLTAGHCCLDLSG